MIILNCSFSRPLHHLLHPYSCSHSVQIEAMKTNSLRHSSSVIDLFSTLLFMHYFCTSNSWCKDYYVQWSSDFTAFPHFLLSQLQINTLYLCRQYNSRLTSLRSQLQCLHTQHMSVSESYKSQIRIIDYIVVSGQVLLAEIMMLQQKVMFNMPAVKKTDMYLPHLKPVEL